MNKTAKEEILKIGKRLKQARLLKNMSQLKLSKEAKIGSQANVAQHENGHQNISEESLKKYSEVLGVSLSWLRYGVKDSQDDPDVTHVPHDQEELEEAKKENALLKKMLLNILKKNPNIENF
jgi:transcriptional regulator with XRE-family HTH domain